MSSERPKTRDELYERIRQSSKDEFIVEDMIRLGFWPERGVMPQDPAEEIRRRGELQRELGELRKGEQPPLQRAGADQGNAQTATP